MLAITPKHRVYLAIQAIDFRCGIDGICALCQEHLALNPFSGHYFIFRNRKATAIKILAYDSQGFWLCHKRLSKGSFRHWPKAGMPTVLFSTAQLHVLLQNGNPGRVDCEPPWQLIE